MGYNIRGEVVSEAEAATGLGFKDVTEFRRWDTEMGHKVGELEYALKQARDERDRFQSTGRKMMAMLEKVDAVLEGIINGTPPEDFDLKRMRLAIQVVCGHAVDWNHILDDFGL